MTDQADLERGYRRLLAWYPPEFRRENGQEILAVLMAGARDGQRRPGLAESADLIRSGVWMRLRPSVARSARTVQAAVRLMYAGAAVSAVGCGSGHAVNLMAGAFPRSRFAGFDLSDTGLTAARAEAGRKALTNVRFDKRDATRLGETARFDFITTFDSVHDQARPDLVLAGIAQALRPGGVYLCVNIAASSKLSENLDHPFGPFGYTVSCMHCMTVSLADGGMGLVA